MKITLRRCLLVFAVCVFALAQTKFSDGPIIPTTTVGGLPAASASTGKSFYVSDGNPGCGTGGGTTLALCRSNGSSWATVSGGSGGGATAASTLTDGLFVRTSSTVVTLTFPVAGTNMGSSSYVSPLAGTVTLTLSAGAAAAGTTFYLYWNPASPTTVIVDTSGSSGSLADVACGGTLGCSTGNNGAAAYPLRVKPIGRLTAGNSTANQFDAFSSCNPGVSFSTGCADDRAFLSVSAVNVGTGITQVVSNGVTTLSVDGSIVPFTFFGTSAPGSVSGNLPGDLFSDTTDHNIYQCNAPSGTSAPACTSVSVGSWTQLNGGGSGWNPLDYTVVNLADDFFPGGTTSLLSGLFWWPNYVGSGFAASLNPSPVNHPGVAQLQTTTATNDQTNIAMMNSNNQAYSFHLGTSGDFLTWEVNSIIESDTAVTTTSFWTGFTSGYTNISYSPTSSIGVYYDTTAHACSSGSSSTADLVYIVRAASTDTCHDSGIAVAANTWYRVRIVSSTAGTIGFQVSTNGGAYSTLFNINTNVPTVALLPNFGVITRTTAARNMYVDRWAFNATGISR